MTTEEQFKKYSSLYQFEEGSPEYLIDKEDFMKCMIGFAKFHVIKALEDAAEKATVIAYIDTDLTRDITINKSSILDAYRLDLIK